MRTIDSIRQFEWKAKHIFAILDIVKFILLVGLLLTFINFNVKLSSTVSTTKNLATQTKTLTAQNKELSQENKQLLQEQEQGIASVHGQINCVLQFFSQAPTTRSSSTITQPVPCLITTSSSGGATGGTKSG